MKMLGSISAHFCFQEIIGSGLTLWYIHVYLCLYMCLNLCTFLRKKLVHLKVVHVDLCVPGPPRVVAGVQEALTPAHPACTAPWHRELELGIDLAIGLGTA